MKNQKIQKAGTIRKTTFKERNHGLTPPELAIAQASIESIIKEYNLIQQKKSRLSSHLRKVVELKIQFYIKQGKIKKSSLNAG